MLQSPEDYPVVGPTSIDVVERNGEKQLARMSPEANIKIRRYLHFLLAVTYFYTKPLIEVL